MGRRGGNLTCRLKGRGLAEDIGDSKYPSDPLLYATACVTRKKALIGQAQMTDFLPHYPRQKLQS